VSLRVNGVATGATGSTTGLDAARPAAGTAGSRYTATDTGAVYLDDGSVWHPIAADIATMQGWSDTAYLNGGTGASLGPAGGPGWSFVACVYVTTLPGAFRGFATYSTDGGARGWVLGIGQDTANRLSLGHVNGGAVNVVIESSAIATGWHTFAVAMASDGLSAQWSVDGSAAATVAVTLTAYTAPDASSLFALGRFSYATYPAPVDFGIAAVVVHHAVLSGAQLATITGTPSDGRVLTPAGVAEDFAFRSALAALPASLAYTSGGATPRTLTPTGAVRTVVR